MMTTCAICSAELVRRPNERPCKFRRRVTCGPVCLAEHKRRICGHRLPPEPADPFVDRTPLPDAVEFSSYVLPKGVYSLPPHPGTHVPQAARC